MNRSIFINLMWYDFGYFKILGIVVNRINLDLRIVCHHHQMFGIFYSFKIVENGDFHSFLVRSFCIHFRL